MRLAMTTLLILLVASVAMADKIPFRTCDPCVGIAGEIFPTLDWQILSGEYMADDNSAFVSDPMYREMVMPYNMAIYERYGRKGRYLHADGPNDHHFKIYADVMKLTEMDIGGFSDVEQQAIIEDFGKEDSDVRILLCSDAGDRKSVV